MSISLEELNEKGFVFIKYELPEKCDRIEDLAEYLMEYIADLLPISGESIYYDIDCLSKGDELKPHYHIIPGTFQVVTWVHETFDFNGRHFIFGNPEKLHKFKPEQGVMCFMKANDSNFVHGVTELLSDTTVKSIGFSSLVIPFTEGMNNDIFVSDYSIED